MERMKDDMAGGAAACAMRAISLERPFASSVVPATKTCLAAARSSRATF
jgi:hypothetical protein